jgi:type II secretory pathway pseudopilin PulG
MKQKVKLSIDRSLSGSQRGGEESERLAFNLQPSRCAFTIIELVGVMAIVAIIAAALAPNIIKRIDRAAWQRETSDLNSMANGLVQTVLKDRQVPSHVTISNAVSSYLDLALSQVSITPRGISRLFLADPGLTNALGGTLPYVQGSSGLPTRPSAARMMIVSTIAKGPSISGSFSDIWNTPEGSAPTNWTGKPDDLCIKRIELGSLFRRVCLINNDTNQYGIYRLEGQGTQHVYVESHGTRNFFVLDGTALNLYRNQDSNDLQLRIIVDRDLSFGYQNHLWSGDISSWLGDDLGPFGEMVGEFLSVTCNTIPARSVTRQEVVNQFYYYLFAYVIWAKKNFDGAPATPETPGYRSITDAQVDLGKFTDDLISGSTP